MRQPDTQPSPSNCRSRLAAQTAAVIQAEARSRWPHADDVPMRVPVSRLVSAHYERASLIVRQQALRPVGEVFGDDVVATQLRFCIDTVGVNRILYSVDYPFISNDDAATFLEQADLPEEAKAAIAHGNTERLLKLP
jgi:Amidohydrolase